MSEMQDNVSVKTIAQTEQILDTVIKLNDEGVSFCPLLWGNHGIGKTSLIESLAERNDAEYVVLNLANLDIADLLGQLDGEGGYHQPNWLKTTKKRVIYFLDEINRAPKYILQGIFNFLNEKRIHNYKAKQEDIIIAAANPSDKEYEVTCFEDPAFLSRFLHVKMQPSQKEYIKFLNNDTSFKNTIIQQALKKSVTLYGNPEQQDFSLGFVITPDNRKLHKISKTFEILSDNEIEDSGVMLLECAVGFDAASVILETWRDSKKNMFEPKEIVNMKKTEKYKFNNDDIDIINNINVKMIDFLGKNKKQTKKEIEGLERYIDYIPKDLRVDFLKQMTTTSGREDLITQLDHEKLEELLNISS